MFLLHVFWVDWNDLTSKEKDKQYILTTLPKRYKIEIKILADLGLAWSGFEQPDPVLQICIVNRLKFRQTHMTQSTQATQSTIHNTSPIYFWGILKLLTETPANSDTVIQKRYRDLKNTIFIDDSECYLLFLRNRELSKRCGYFTF